MKKGIVGPRKIIIFLVFISILIFQANFARADEWKDAGFAESEAQEWKDAGFTKNEAVVWKRDGFTPKEAAARKPPRFISKESKESKEEEMKAREKEMKARKDAEEAPFWKDAGYSPDVVTALKAFSFSTPAEVKQFEEKYCKKGFAIHTQYTRHYFPPMANPPPNYNEADGAACYVFFGNVFQLLGDHEALYRATVGGDIYHVTFDKGGRAVSLILAIVTVKGSYKYRSLAAINMVPELRVVKELDIAKTFGIGK